MKRFSVYIALLLLISCTTAKTDLMKACSKCNYEKVIAELEASPDLNSITDYGWSALTWAVYCGPRITRAVLEAGADPDNVSASGSTALHSAAGIGSLQVIELLLVYGADRTITDVDGRTAADYALEREQPEAALLIEVFQILNEQATVMDAEMTGVSIPPPLLWGENLEDLIVQDAFQDFEQNEKNDATVIYGNWYYLGYKSYIEMNVDHVTGLNVVFLHINDTTGTAYSDIFHYCELRYDPEWVYDIEQFWIGETEHVYVLIDMFEGTFCYFIEKSYALELKNQ